MHHGPRFLYIKFARHWNNDFNSCKLLAQCCWSSFKQLRLTFFAIYQCKLILVLMPRHRRLEMIIFPFKICIIRVLTNGPYEWYLINIDFYSAIYIYILGKIVNLQLSCVTGVNGSRLSGSNSLWIWNKNYWIIIKVPSMKTDKLRGTDAANMRILRCSHFLQTSNPLIFLHSLQFILCVLSLPIVGLN